MVTFMRVKSPKNLFGVLCLSLAVGLLLYWVMFMNVLPRTLRPEASTLLPLISAVVGASVCGLLYFGLRGVFASFRLRGRGESAAGLVLRRNAAGRVVAVDVSDEPPMVRRASSRTTEGRAGPSIGRVSTGQLKALKAAILVSLVVEAYLIIVCVFGTWMPVYAIPSDSMAPVLNVGDLVLVRGVDAFDVKEGDIMVFNVPPPYNEQVPSPVIHRVISVGWDGEKPFFRTKGDNPRASEDPWVVPAENVIGVHVARFPYLGYVVLALKKPLGLGLAISALIVWALFPQLKSFWLEGVKSHERNF
jgi:signal peptidase I